jgi:hypothetical protein
MDNDATEKHILPLSLISFSLSLFFFINFYVSLHVKAYMHAHGKRRTTEKKIVKKEFVVGILGEEC